MKRLKYYIPLYGAYLFAIDEYERDYQKFLKSDEIYFKASMDALQKSDYFMMALLLQASLYIYLPLMLSYFL